MIPNAETLLKDIQASLVHYAKELDKQNLDSKTEALISFKNSLENFLKPENAPKRSIKTIYCLDSCELDSFIFKQNHASRQFRFNNLLSANASGELFEQMDFMFMHELIYKHDVPVFMLRPHYDEYSQMQMYYLKRLIGLSDSSSKEDSPPLSSEKFTPTDKQLIEIKDCIEQLKCKNAVTATKENINAANQKLHEFLEACIPNLNAHQIKLTIEQIDKLRGNRKVSNLGNIIRGARDNKNNTILARPQFENCQSLRKVYKCFREVEELEFTIDPELIDYLASIKLVGNATLQAARDIEAILRVCLLNEEMTSHGLPYQFKLVSRTPSLHALFGRIKSTSLNQNLIHPLFIPELYNITDDVRTDDEIRQLLENIRENIRGLFKQTHKTLLPLLRKNAVKQRKASSNDFERFPNENEIRITDSVYKQLSEAATDNCKNILTCISATWWQTDASKNLDFETSLNSFITKNSKENLVDLCQTILAAIDVQLFKEENSLFFRLIENEMLSAIEDNIRQDIDEDTTIVFEVTAYNEEYFLPSAIRLLNGYMKVTFFLHSDLQKARLLGIKKTNTLLHKLTVNESYNPTAKLSPSRVTCCQWKTADLFKVLLQLEEETDEQDTVLLNDIALLQSAVIASIPNFELATLIVSQRLSGIASHIEKLVKEDIVSSKFEDICELLSYKELYLLRHFAARGIAFDTPIDYRANAVREFRKAERDFFYASQLDEFARLTEFDEQDLPNFWLHALHEDPRLMTAHAGGFLEQMFKAWGAERRREDRERRKFQERKLPLSKDLWHLTRLAYISDRKMKKITLLLSRPKYADKIDPGHIAVMEFLAHRCLQINLTMFLVAMATDQRTPMLTFWESNDFKIQEHLDFIKLKRWHEDLRKYSKSHSFSIDSVTYPSFVSFEVLNETVGFFLNADRSLRRFKEVNKLLKQQQRKTFMRQSFYGVLLKRLEDRFEERIEHMESRQSSKK